MTAAGVTLDYFGIGIRRSSAPGTNETLPLRQRMPAFAGIVLQNSL
jgi:hypothetical protein